MTWSPPASPFGVALVAAASFAVGLVVSRSSASGRYSATPTPSASKAFGGDTAALHQSTGLPVQNFSSYASPSIALLAAVGTCALAVYQAQRRWQTGNSPENGSPTTPVTNLELQKDTAKPWDPLNLSAEESEEEAAVELRLRRAAEIRHGHHLSVITFGLGSLCRVSARSSACSTTSGEEPQSYSTEVSDGSRATSEDLGQASSGSSDGEEGREEEPEDENEDEQDSEEDEEEDEEDVKAAEEEDSEASEEEEDEEEDEEDSEASEGEEIPEAAEDEPEAEAGTSEASEDEEIPEAAEDEPEAGAGTSEASEDEEIPEAAEDEPEAGAGTSEAVEEDDAEAEEVFVSEGCPRIPEDSTSLGISDGEERESPRLPSLPDLREDEDPVVMPKCVDTAPSEEPQQIKTLQLDLVVPAQERPETATAWDESQDWCDRNRQRAASKGNGWNSCSFPSGRLWSDDTDDLPAVPAGPPGVFHVNKSPAVHGWTRTVSAESTQSFAASAFDWSRAMSGESVLSSAYYSAAPGPREWSRAISAESVQSCASRATRVSNMDQDDKDMTLRSIMQALETVDADRVLQVRRIKQLGFGSTATLREHCSQFGQVDRVLVSHSRAQARLRPASLGFIVMVDAAGVKAVLAAGTEHRIGEVTVKLGSFQRPGAGDEEEA